MNENNDLKNQHAEKGTVPLGDLNLSFIEDPELANGLTEDCIKLLESAEKNFDSIKNQTWYKRLWAQLSGGNTRRQAMACGTLSQAQQLLSQVLVSHAKATGRQSALLVSVAGGLKELQGQQNLIVKGLIRAASRLDSVEEEVKTLKDCISQDSADERTWSLAHKVILLKLMVLVANADNEIHKAERDIIIYKMSELDIPNNIQDEIKDMLWEPEKAKDVFIEIDHLDSIAMRKNIYRIVSCIAWADGELKKSERVQLVRLAKSLGLDSSFAEEVLAELRPDGCEFTINYAKRFEGVQNNASIYEINKQVREDIEQVENQRMQDKEEIRVKLEKASNEFGKIIPVFSEEMSYLVTGSYIQYFQPRLEAYEEIETGDEIKVEDVLSWFEPAGCNGCFLNGANEAKKVLQAIVEDWPVESYHPALISTLHEDFDSAREVKEERVNDAIELLWDRGQNTIKINPTFMKSIMKGGVAGVIGVTLLGPLGILGATLGAAGLGKLDQDNFEKGCELYDETYKKVIDKYDDLIQTCNKIIRNSLGKSLRDVGESLIKAKTPENLEELVEVLNAQLKKTQDERSEHLNASEQENVDSQLELENKDLNSDIISGLVKTLFINNEHILMGDNIPIKKETNARNKCKIPNDESIVVLIDMTVFGSAKNVICITKRSIYWNGIWTSKQPGPGKALFSELNSASFEILDGQHIQVTPDKWVSDNGSSMSTKDIQTFLIGLRDLKLS